jgi:hypothetical protein
MRAVSLLFRIFIITAPCLPGRAPGLPAGMYLSHPLLMLDDLATGSPFAPLRDAIFFACLPSCFFFFAISRWRFSKE